jgi:hypothetical protein
VPRALDGMPPAVFELGTNSVCHGASPGATAGARLMPQMSLNSTGGSRELLM